MIVAAIVVGYLLVLGVLWAFGRAAAIGDRKLAEQIRATDRKDRLSW